MRKSDNNSYALHVKHLSKKYAKHNVIKDCSFVVPQGSFCGFVGPNGAGKTTTIKMIIDAYSEFRFQGEILIFDQKHNSKKAKQLIGYIPEKSSFPLGVNVFNYLKGLAYLSGNSWKESANMADNVIKMMDLQVLAKKRPIKLSSGEQKKVLLAQAVMNNPKLLIMDEPCANLDPIARQNFFEYLVKLNQQGITIFISSHILTELEQYISYVVMMDRGQVLAQGSLAKITKNTQMTNHLNYEITFTKGVSSLLVDFLTSHQIAFEANQSKLALELKNRAELTSINTFLLDNQIEYVSITQVKRSLQGALLEQIDANKKSKGNHHA